MTTLSLDRYAAEIVTQTERLRDCVKGADLHAPVPSCPEWTLGQLLRHLNGAHRWAQGAVGSRSTEPVSDELVNDVPRIDGESAEALDAQLADGAARLAETLRAAGPDVPVWTPGPGGTPMFWARRMAYETAVHRADAALAVGVEYTLDAEPASDALDEWMDFGTVPEAYESEPTLLGPGRTLRFQATDTGARWLVDLTGPAPVWCRTDEEAAVTVRGPLTELLLLIYRRPAPRVDVLGDTALLELWLTRTGFWLQ
ncbi:maleylpyruvate isomerase family mycothiol-dependent enzyme [Streptomyces coffeae]|uniref:Maleylpyruvate isomerase family mycothiol-dependent enzyme n=1 Tax=Streptomyces coffeae TaxID=621382 RepID=A0ABS1NH03_9ACTN|nr:maleylpyruvate isomerase family mycothiol-dependent enzyme [Streptomyces coffeae]MBL1099349.1 maleylpyruvate isomerase family mycothiol-dependent enzyme [Streptomyces coffeae]